MGKNVSKNISKNLSGKFDLKHFDNAKQSATDALITASKRVIQKTAEASCHLIGNKIVDKIRKVWKSSPKNNSEQNEEEILREKIIDDLRLIEEN